MNIPGRRLKIRGSLPVAEVELWQCFDVLIGVVNVSLVRNKFKKDSNSKNYQWYWSLFSDKLNLQYIVVVEFEPCECTIWWMCWKERYIKLKMHVSQKRGIFSCSRKRINVFIKSIKSSVLLSFTPVYTVYSLMHTAVALGHLQSPSRTTRSTHCFQNVFMAFPQKSFKIH